MSPDWSPQSSAEGSNALASPRAAYSFSFFNMVISVMLRLPFMTAWFILLEDSSKDPRLSYRSTADTDFMPFREYRESAVFQKRVLTSPKLGTTVTAGFLYRVSP